MKMKKSKNVLLSGMLIGTIALASVGFSTWVITLNVSQNETGNIVVDKVENSSRYIILKTEDNNYDKNIVFGSDTPSSMNKYSWYEVSGTPTGDLEAVIVFEMASTTVDEVDDHLSIKVTSGNEYDTLLADGYVGALPSFNVENVSDVGVSLVKVDLNNGSVKVTATLTFSWGDEFVTPFAGNSATGNTSNPTDYFNNLEPNSTNVALAESLLGEEGTLSSLNKKTFTVTLSTF